MSVRDLLAILRLIDRAAQASIVVAHDDDVICINVGDLDAEACANLRSILYKAYVRRGHIAVAAKRHRTEWAFTNFCRGILLRLRSPLELPPAWRCALSRVRYTFLR